MNTRFTRIARERSGRKGSILILFALLTFVFLAIAGLVIDVGLANLTQSQMQVAVDSAALEGCRWRNFDESPESSTSEKRGKASAMVRLAFDDDLHPTQGGYIPGNGTGFLPPDDADAANLSAGPGLRVSGGTGAWAANAVLSNQPDSELARLDDPRLRRNNANRPYGDMVTGVFHDIENPLELPTETAGYARNDFTPSDNGTDWVSALSFLVRMRRAGDANPNDVQNNVSSSLPTLPIVFGLGSTILQAPGENWDPRRDGITVRATAIASARPAMRVGRPPCDGPDGPIFDHEPSVSDPEYRERISGLAPFFIYLESWVSHFRGPAWQALLPDPEDENQVSQGTVRVGSEGQLVLESTGATVGHFLFDAVPTGSDPCASESGWPEVVGRAVPRALSSSVRHFRYTKRKPAYIAIVDSIPDPNGNSVLRVVGYGFAHLLRSDVGSTSTVEFEGTGTFLISAGEVLTHGPFNCWIAQDNASAILNSAADSANIDTNGAPVLSTSEWLDVLRRSNLLAYGTYEPDPARIYDYTYIQRGTVLAPALTR